MNYQCSDCKRYFDSEHELEMHQRLLSDTHVKISKKYHSIQNKYSFLPKSPLGIFHRIK